jgi:hypothetical protein
MPGEEVERDLLEHPRSLAVAQADIERIRAALKSPSAEYSPAVSGDARVLYLLMLRGTDHYLAPAYSVRLRRIVGCRYAKNVSDSGVLSIYSIGQLEAEAVVAQTPLPSRLCYKLEHIPVETVNAGELLNYQWGWLKKPSTETQAARQRIEINTEWLAGLWSTYIYPPFGG